MAHVLIIDDSKAIREMLRESLEDLGHRVTHAGNGHEGIQVQREDPADLVVCDIFMPEKDGISTIRELRQAYPALRILAMSGGDRDLVAPEEFLNLAKRFGADEVMAKPMKLHAFEAAVLRLLES